MAHELGHNFSLRHAPCGGPRGVDKEYPHKDGRIGAWGYDHRDEEVVKPSTKDLMSYCSPRWIGSYHFTAAANYRTMHRMEVRQGAERSLLVWGSRSASGELSMDPPLVVKGSPLLPDLRTGRVRAIRGDFAEPPRVPPGHVVRWSRGIPDQEAWRLR